MSLPGSRLLFLTLVAGTSATLVASGSSTPHGRGQRESGPGDWVEMEVVGVAGLEDDASSVVVLREKKGGTVLPIFIGKTEGEAIDLRLHHASPSRPLTHDLLGKAIEALGARVVRIEIAGVRDAIFTASIQLEQRGRKVELDARPSDSIALALGSEVPIMVSRRVLDDAGLSPQELDQMRKRMERGGPEARQGGTGHALDL